MAILITDGTGRYIDVNDAAVDLLGYTKEELLMLSIADIDNTGNVLTDFETLKKTGYVNSENQLLRKNGEIVHVRMEAVVLEKNRYMAFCSDLTEQKKLAERLQQSQKLESIGTLAGGIAHNFNNLLAAIIGYTELAMDDVDYGTPIHDNLWEVMTASKRARDLVKQMLSFARQSYEVIEPIKISRIVHEVMKMISSWIPSTIVINQYIESESLVMGDATQLHQILINLCTNAAHAMEDGGGALTVRLSDVMLEEDVTAIMQSLNPGKYVRLSVTDTGTGIAPDVLGSIFDPYFTTKGPDKGTGMGLAMVHGVIENYGGSISVDTRVGEGTTFTIFLPVVNEPAQSEPSPSEEIRGGIESILFVDDDVAIVEMQQQMMTRMGYTVTALDDSLAALDMFRVAPESFDLVITDMTMPQMTGDRLAFEIKKIRPDIPVILCTGFSEKINIRADKDLQIDAFLIKPVNMAKMAQAIRKLLDE